MRIFLIILFIIASGCKANKVSKNHGFISLETKFEKIQINKTNKNDLIKTIGHPSSISEFDENKWFYIERKKTNQSLFKLGIKKINKNNILIVDFNNKGLVENKKIIDLNNMNDVKYVKKITQKEFDQDNTIYNIFSSLREKINAPARNRNKSN
jgi:outer membrane protein assembly factor BamE (lipoprotein component of BamABCDE complex)|tara:strand:- start:1942 stop:2403 length:462 start_codon:yes stop_codon:yes gene_type:complete